MKKLLLLLVGLMCGITYGYPVNNQLMMAQVGVVNGEYPTSISSGQFMDCFNGSAYESNAVYAAYDYSNLQPGSYIRLIPINPEVNDRIDYLKGSVCGYGDVPLNLQGKYGYWYNTVTVVASDLNI